MKLLANGYEYVVWHHFTDGFKRSVVTHKMANGACWK